jgi:endonuclease G, mitochondrial
MNYLVPALVAIPVIAGVTYFTISGSGDEEKNSTEKTEIAPEVIRELGSLPSKRYRAIVLDTSYNHNKWGTMPVDLVYNFAAYTTSFDSDDDDNGDNKPDVWGVPEWVAFEIKSHTGEMPKYERPSPWLTDRILYGDKKAPNDKTYAVSGTRDMKIVSMNSRFVRGHMCPKSAADRMGEDAGYNTHTVLNAVPQLQLQNNGIWKKLEKNCTEWADKYGSVWVVSGPAFFGKNPAMWLGQAGEVSAAIPDATYKIIIRENKDSETGVECMAFLFPNIIDSKYKIPSEFLTSVADIEKVTGLTFLNTLSDPNRNSEIAKNAGLTNTQRSVVFGKW